MDAPLGTQTKEITLKIRRWPDYNKDGVLAPFVVVKDDLEQLPRPVVDALTIRRREVSGLYPADAVNWNACVLTADGRTVLGSAHLEGGSRSGTGCAEDALWVTEKDGSAQNRNVPFANGCAFFKYESAIYVIDGGLCPCRRCCGSLLGLAKALNSHIVVRPLVDYEFIKVAPTTLELDATLGKQTYFLLFKPDSPSFVIFYEKDVHAPTHLLSTVKAEVVVSSTLLSFGCPAGHYAKVECGKASISTGQLFKCLGKHCTKPMSLLEGGVPLGKKFTTNAFTELEEKKARK